MLREVVDELNLVGKGSLDKILTFEHNLREMRSQTVYIFEGSLFQKEKMESIKTLKWSMLDVLWYNKMDSISGVF